MSKSKKIHMKTKLFTALFICILILFSFVSCTKNADKPVNSPENAESDNISDLLPGGQNMNDLLNGEKNEDPDLTPEDMAAATTGFPSFAYAFALNEKDFENEDYEGFDKIEYNGGEINIFCKLTAGGYSDIEIGIRAFINGVAQSLLDTSASTDMICKEIEKNKSEIVKITFVPNIGKKGEVMELCFDLVLQPNVIKGEDERYSFSDDGANPVGNLSLIMNADSSNTAEKEICDAYSNTVISKVNKLIYQGYTSYDGFEETNAYFDQVGFGIYENIDDFVYIKKTDDVVCTNRYIKTTASESKELTLNLHGKPGKYRVCFLLNGEMLDVFDGKRFADVTVERNMQTELKILIDTSKLPKDNKVCFYAQELDDEYNEDNPVVRTDVFKLIVTDAK